MGDFTDSMVAGAAVGYLTQTTISKRKERLAQRRGKFYNAEWLRFVKLGVSEGYTPASYYPFLLTDVRDNLQAIKFSAPAYFKSLTFKILFAIMVLIHGFAVYSFLLVGQNPMFWGGPVVTGIMTTLLVSFSVVLVLAALSPILTTFEYFGVWRVVGGRPRLVERLAILIASIPVLAIGFLMLNTASGPVSYALGVAGLLGYSVLPLVLRFFGSRNLRKAILETQAENDIDFLGELLEQKVIGTPGASLETSEFSQEQVAAGVAGERKTAKILDHFAQTHDNAIVFHSVRWNMAGASYDIDHVVVIQGCVFFLDTKQWNKADYLMLEHSDTVLRNGEEMPNGEIHIQAGADTYINEFQLDDTVTQLVVWTNGTLSNMSLQGVTLLTGDELEEWVNHSAATAKTLPDSNFNIDLLYRLKQNTAA